MSLGFWDFLGYVLSIPLRLMEVIIIAILLLIVINKISNK